MRAPWLLAVLLLAGCARPPAGPPALCDPAAALGSPAPSAGLEQPVHPLAREVGGWRVRFEPENLTGAPGEVVPFAVVLTPRDAGAQATNLTATAWMRFAGGSGSVAVPAQGGRFDAEMLVGAERQSTFVLTPDHAPMAGFPGPVATPQAPPVAQPVEALTARDAARLPDGFCATADGDRVLAVFSLGTRILDCGAAATPVGNATFAEGRLVGFVAWGQGDVCSEGGPSTPRAVFRGPPLAPGHYLAVAHATGTWQGTAHLPPPGWSTHEGTVTIGKPAG
jgi:hypothetical protein